MNLENFSRKTTPAQTPQENAEGVREQETGNHTGEQAWHAERWHRKSEDPSNKTFLGNTKRTPEDFMREEAERDNEDFDKRRHEEFETWQKDLRVVIENFKEKARNPEKRCINVIYMKGGGMKAAYTAGQILALNQMGLTSDTVDYIFGSSSGSVVAAAYAGGPEETGKGIKMLIGPLSSPDFINPSPKKIWEQNVINLALAERLMSEGTYAFDEEKIKGFQGKLYFNVTEPVVKDATPTVRFLDMTGENRNLSIARGIRSSMSLPGLTGDIPDIDGEKFYDGDFNQLPIEEVIAKVKTTLPPDMEGAEINILILPQTPFELMENIEPSQTEYNLASITKAANWAAIGRSASLRQAHKMLLAREELRKDLEEIQKTEHVNIGIMWPPNDALDTLNIDSDAAQAAIIASARDTIKQFGGQQPDRITY